MYARISTYDFDEEHAADAADAFRAAFARLRGVEGLEAAYFLRASEGRRGVSITFWDTEAAMSATRATASRLRTEAADAISGEIVSVEEYEVAVADEKAPRVE